MRRIYGDGRHHLMEASPRSTPAHPFTLPSNELRHSRTKFNRPFLSLALSSHPSSLFFSCLPCSPVRRLSLFAIVRLRRSSVESTVRRDRLPLPLYLPVGSCFHWFALRKAPARSFHASLPLLHCTLLYFNSLVLSFSFARGSLFISFFAAHIHPSNLSQIPRSSSLTVIFTVYARPAFLLGYFLHFREAPLTCSFPPVYLK